MKTSWLILLALFTVCSCKFSFDKAKVEESYGSGGGGGGGGSCNIDPTSSSILTDASGIADGVTNFTINLTIMDDCGMPVEGETVAMSVDGNGNSSINCTDMSSGNYECKFTSTIAENKNISLDLPAELSSLSGLPVSANFTKPPLKLNLTACLGGARVNSLTSFPMRQELNIPQFSPYNFSSWFTGGDVAINAAPVGTEVDWVLVQLYSNADPLNPDPLTSTPLAAKSAVIHTDGTITEPGAAAGTGIIFGASTAIPDDYEEGYYLNIIHRNHLPIALNDAIIRPTPAPSPSHPLDININLTTSSYLGGQVAISENPYLIVGASKCMRPGNYNQDFIVDSTDKNVIVADMQTLTGIDTETNLLVLNNTYLNTDINLDGNTQLRFSPATLDAQELIDNIMTGVSKPIWGLGAP